MMLAQIGEADAARLAAAVAGPFVGSFVGATADRLLARTPVLTARSRCDACGRVLRFVDLVPIASWLRLRGRCHHCGAAIGAWPLAAEVAGLTIGVASALALPGWRAFAGAAFGWALLLLALLDLRDLWLPRVGGWGLAAAAVALAALAGWDALEDALIGAALGWALLAALGAGFERLRGVEALGEGDPPLLAAAGAWVGWQGLGAVLLLAATTGIAHALIGGTRRVPFGAHLAFAMWAVWLTGRSPG